MTKVILGRLITFAFSILLLLSNSVRAQGILIGQHSGSTNPTNEGFSFASAGVTRSVGPVIGDMGMNAWATAVSPDNTLIFYGQSLTPEQQSELNTSDWVLSLRLRMIGSSLTSSSGLLANHTATVSTGSQDFRLFIGSELDGDPFVRVGGNPVDTPVYTLQGGGPGYHDYQLKYSAAAQTADLWIDGVDRMSGIMPDHSDASDRFWWGEGFYGPSQANWNLVSLEIVPEPAPLRLVLVGGAALFLRRFPRLRSR